MKRFISISLALLIISTPVYADTIKASVNGLVCAFCATGIEKTFKKQAAVDTVKIDLDNKLVTIGTKPNQALDDATVTKLLTDSGYTVIGIDRSK